MGLFSWIFTSEEGSNRRQRNREARRAERARRFDARQAGRAGRVQLRQETLSNLASLAGSIVGGSGGRDSVQGLSDSNANSSGTQSSAISPLTLGIIGVVAYMLLNKKR